MNSADLLGRVRVVLLRSRSPGNVGSTARAMRNFGLENLWLAELPEFSDPAFFDRESAKMAWRARDMVAAATRVDTLDAALEGTTFSVGTSPRSLEHAPVLDVRQAAEQMAAELAAGGEVALVFGGEADGIRNHEISRMTRILRIPTGDRYPELNLSQAVVVCVYELFQAVSGLGPSPGIEDARGDDAPAPYEQHRALHRAAVELLEKAEFLSGENLALADELGRRMSAARPSRREATLLQGIVRQLRWAVGRGADAP